MDLNRVVTDQELREGRLVFYRKDLNRIDRILEEFVRLSGARSVLLVDKEGHLITEGGEEPGWDQDTVSALVAGSFSATRELARILGEQEFTSLYHEGTRRNIQLSLILERTILTVLFDETTTLGMVRLYVNEVVRKLEELLRVIERERRQAMATGEVDEALALQDEFGDSARETLDALFDQ